LLREAIDRVPATWTYQALSGVGEIRIGADAFEQGSFMDLREWAETNGGALVVTEAPSMVYQTVDPWGTAPAGMALQRRVVARFDPDRVVNPGRLPGGL
jgi:FAD/FMN-containing dehydrogenase